MDAPARIHHTATPPSGTGRPAAQRRAGASFHRVLADAFDARVAASSAQPHARHAVAHVPARGRPVVPDSASSALTQAMTAEGVPQSWQAGLNFIMAKESGGRVDAQSPVHSARGLYQLTAANYHYNPHGAASFGNPVEEAQGGIRYIRARYGNADQAAAFWRTHHWY